MNNGTNWHDITIETDVVIVGAQELIDRLMDQIAPFKPTFHFGQQVDVLERESDGRFYLHTTLGQKFLTKTVIIGGGDSALDWALDMQPRANTPAVLRAIAAFAIEEQLNPGQKAHLQYTRTSPVMHQRLGDDDPYQDEFEAA